MDLAILGGSVPVHMLGSRGSEASASFFTLPVSQHLK